MVEFIIKLDYANEEEFRNSFIWEKYLSHTVGFSVCESFQIVDEEYRRQLRNSFAMARCNGVRTTDILKKYGYSKFSEVPDSVLPVLERALIEAPQKPEHRAQDTIAEHTAELVRNSTEEKARTIYTFANALINHPKQ